MPMHIFRIIFPKVTIEQLGATKDKSISIKQYSKTTITQLGMGIA